LIAHLLTKARSPFLWGQGVVGGWYNFWYF
jgi:hypothetical protein